STGPVAGPAALAEPTAPGSAAPRTAISSMRGARRIRMCPSERVTHGRSKRHADLGRRSGQGRASDGRPGRVRAADRGLPPYRVSRDAFVPAALFHASWSVRSVAAEGAAAEGGAAGFTVLRRARAA